MEPSRIHVLLCMVLIPALTIGPASAGGTALESAQIQEKEETETQKSESEAAAAARKKAEKLVAGMKATQRDALLETLNNGSATDLQQLPGIDEATAERIRKARPFKSVVDLADVTGIGEVKFEQIIKHAKKLRTHESEAAAAARKKAEKLVAGMKATQRDALLETLNNGSATDLQQLPGIDEATAEKIRKARPFKSVVDLADVTGIGEVKFEQIIMFAK